jgi:hypothetical protein
MVASTARLLLLPPNESRPLQVVWSRSKAWSIQTQRCEAVERFLILSWLCTTANFSFFRPLWMGRKVHLADLRLRLRRHRGQVRDRDAGGQGEA